MSEDELNTIDKDIKEEANIDSDLRQQYGQRWNRPLSLTLDTQINEKIAGDFRLSFLCLLSMSNT